LKKGMVMVLAVALLAVATTANAQIFGKGKMQITFGLTHFQTFTVDTIYSGFPSVEDHNALGFGAFFKYNLSDNWGIDAGGFYGFGSENYEYTVSTAFEEKYRIKAIGFRVGVDHTVNIGDRTGLYFGPGISFVSARSGVKTSGFTPDVDDDNPRTTTISLDGRIGAQAMLGKNFGVKANLGQNWNRSSVSFDYDLGGGSQEFKISRWWSSTHGYAGFVIYVN